MVVALLGKKGEQDRVRCSAPAFLRRTRHCRGAQWGWLGCGGRSRCEQHVHTEFRMMSFRCK